MIEFHGVSKTYDEDVQAVRQLDLSIATGEFVFLSGPSGAGKSSILELLTREEKPSQGIVLLDGVDLGRLHDSQVPALRRRMGIIFQRRCGRRADENLEK